MPSALAGAAGRAAATASALPSRSCFSRIAFSLLCGGLTRRLCRNAPPVRRAARPPARLGIAWILARSVWEWPHPEFLLADLPQPRQPVRLDHQEEDDQGADDHELQLLDRRRVQ